MASGEVLALYRALLREARKFPDYNIREYVRRRSMQGFRDGQHIAEKSVAVQQLSFGNEQLQIVRNQSTIYNIYQPKSKNIMELKLQS